MKSCLLSTYSAQYSLAAVADADLLMDEVSSPCGEGHASALRSVVILFPLRLLDAEFCLLFLVCCSLAGVFIIPGSCNKWSLQMGR